MTIETFEVTDRASWLARRQKDVTASAAPALLGIHEYISKYELWALKSGLITEDPEETPAMVRGRLLEGVAVKLLTELYPEISFRQPGLYYRDAAVRLGATPDCIAVDSVRGRGVIQIKSVEPGVFRHKWLIDDEVQPPLWIAVQALVEAHLTRATWAAVAPLRVGHGLDIELIDIPLHHDLMEKIEREVGVFWLDVENKRMPDPDPEVDGKLIERFFPPKGPEIDLSRDNQIIALLDERDALSAERNLADGRLKTIKSELLLKLNGATAGRTADGRLITSKTVSRSAYTVKASSYIDVRVKAAREEKRA